MSDSKTQLPTALLSAYHKDQALADFARSLDELGWQLLVSRGTKKFLDEHGIPCTDVATIVGGDPILNHRVVTLSREVHAGILARTDEPADMKDLADIGVSPIGLVYVSMYPFAEERAKEDHTYQSAIEKIDVGGPTMLLAAAKAGRVVVSSPHQFASVLEMLRSPPEDPMEMRARLGYLALKAVEMVFEYLGDEIKFFQAVSDHKYSDK